MTFPIAPSTPGTTEMVMPRLSRRRWLALLLAVAAAPALAAEVDDEVQHILAAQVAAWNAGDAKALAQDFARDGEMVNLLGTHFQGKDDIERRHAQLFATLFKGSRLELLKSHLRSASHASVVVETEHLLIGFKSLPADFPPVDARDGLRTTLKYVFIREHEHWKVISARFTSANGVALPN